MSLVRLVGTVAASTLAASALFLVPAAEAAPKARPPAVRTVGVGSNPYDVAVAQNLGRAFVVNDGSVSVVSLLTHREIAEFGTGGYQGQNAVALVRGNQQGYITNYNEPTVTVFDTEMHRVVKRIPIDDAGVDVVAANTPKGQRAYVSVLRRNQVAAIQTSTGKVVQRIKLPAGAQTLTARAGGKEIWAGSVEEGRVWVISTRTGTITRTIKVDQSGPVQSIAFAPGAKRAWVAGLGGVTVVDPATGKTKKFVSVDKLFTSPPNMGDIAITSSGRYALVENSTFPEQPGRGQVTLIDTTTAKVVWRIRTGVQPLAIALDRSRNTAYVPNFGDDTVSYFPIPR